MTTIAACSIDGVHAIAADGRCCAGELITSERTAKLLERPEGVVTAHAGNRRTFDLIRLSPEGNDLPTAESLAACLAIIFERHSFERDDEPGAGPAAYRQEHFHVAPSGIVEIGQELALTPIPDRWPAAIGNGADYAIGAMETCLSFSQIETAAEDIVILAVKVAMKRNPWTGGGIMVALRGAKNRGPEWIGESGRYDGSAGDTQG